MKPLFCLLLVLISYVDIINAQQFNLNGDSKTSSDVVRTELKFTLENAKITLLNSYRSKSLTLEKMEELIVTERKKYTDRMEITILYDKTTIQNESKTEVQFDELTGEKLLFQKTSTGYLIENLDQYSTEQQAQIKSIYDYREEAYEKVIYPNNIATGDSWIVEGKELNYLLGKGISKGNAEFTLVKVVNVRGEKIATILYSMDVTYQELGEDGEIEEGNIVLSGKIKRSLTYYIDRGITGVGLITTKGGIKHEGRTVQAEIMSKVVIEGKERLFTER